jgi:hypothetical protein
MGHAPQRGQGGDGEAGGGHERRCMRRADGVLSYYLKQAENKKPPEGGL